MRYITYEDKHIISQIARLHESELERQNQDYQQTTLSVALREEMLLNGLYHGTDVLITHIVDDTLIGVIWGRYLKHEQKVIIEFLYVALRYRQQGIASKLKDEIERWAIEQGAEEIQGTVDAHNIMMQQLNQQKGYQVSKVIMTKKLPLNNEHNKDK